MNTRPDVRAMPSLRAHCLAIRERYFWQSRSNLRDAPHLTDLRDLARAIRRSYAR